MSEEDKTVQTEVATDDSSSSDETKAENGSGALTADEVKKMIQSETDRVRRTFSDQLKTKDEEIETLKTQHMSETERLEHERQKERDDFETEKRQHRKDTLRFDAGKALTAAGLSIEWADRLTFTDQESIEPTVKALVEYIDGEVNKRVQDRFREAGFEPAGGSGTVAQSTELDQITRQLADSENGTTPLQLADRIKLERRRQEILRAQT